MRSIENDIKSRGITRLCHFTKSSKLLHILRNETGIIANDAFLDDQIDLLEKNDVHRLDGKEGYVCCSIEYPNTWYLNRIRNDDSVFRDWVILLINPNLLTDMDTLFCHRNAAANYGAHIREGISGFTGMFGNPVKGKSLLFRSESMLDCCPTDGQAEVLIKSRIPCSDIIGVITQSREQAHREKSRIRLLADARQDINWIVAPGLFDANWNRLIRSGQRPIETPYIEE